MMDAVVAAVLERELKYLEDRIRELSESISRAEEHLDNQRGHYEVAVKQLEIIKVALASEAVPA